MINSIIILAGRDILNMPVTKTNKILPPISKKPLKGGPDASCTRYHDMLSMVTECDSDIRYIVVCN